MIVIAPADQEILRFFGRHHSPNASAEPRAKRRGSNCTHCASGTRELNGLRNLVAKLLLRQFLSAVHESPEGGEVVRGQSVHGAGYDLQAFLQKLIKTVQQILARVEALGSIAGKRGSFEKSGILPAGGLTPDL